MKFTNSVNINFATEKKEIKKALSPLKKKKRKKIDLDKTPLPIFECIYCSDEKIVFNHMIKNILSDKYLYNCSLLDFKNINFIISSYLVYNFAVNKTINSIVNMIVNYSEYFNKLYELNSSREYIKAYSDSKKEEENFKPFLKYKFQCLENNTMTLFFKNTSN